MENKQDMKKEKIQKRQEKLLKILVTVIFILIFMIITLNQFSNEMLGIKDIRSMIGAEYSGGEALTVRENLILRAAVDTYIQFIHSGDFEQAYGSMLPKYREIVSKEIFTEKMTQIGTENFIIQELQLEQIAENLFMFDTTIKNDNKMQILLILDGQNYYIVPESFLEYNEVNESINKKGVKYTLKGYEVDVKSCIFNMTLENNNNEEVEITQVKMKNDKGISYNALNQKVTLGPNETKDISFVVETHLDFPTTLEITRTDNQKIRVYTFELE